MTIGSGLPGLPTRPSAPSAPTAPLLATSPSPAQPIPSFAAGDEAPTFATASFSFNGPDLDNILKVAFEAGASDIHLTAKVPPRNRIDGELVDMPEFPEALTKDWLEKTLTGVMSPDQKEEFDVSKEMDMSHTVDGAGRFRLNVYHQQGMVGAVFRVIPTIIKTIEELKVPAILAELTEKPKGLILVTGETGSGKSTTLAAMIDAINRTRHEHIMTIEDPIEFVHQSRKATINQREVGEDTLSFAEALKRVLRQDPDVILVGELRDPETIAVALTAAETGHLVFGTLHTQSAAKSVTRLVDSFPAHQQAQIKSQLADTVQAIVCQTLLKKIGGGRVAATEIMIRTDAVSNLIREGQVAQIYSAIQTGSTFGMHTLDQDLERLVRAGTVDRDEAAHHLVDPRALDGIGRQTGHGWEA